VNTLETLTVLLGLVALATALGLVWRARTGRIQRAKTSATDADNRISIAGAPEFGTRVTLLQFSTEMCTPCKITHTLLSGLADELDNGTGAVVHVDIDVTSRPEIANQFNLLQSPTTFILDGNGVLQARIGGAPKINDVRAELDRMLGSVLV
jgi:thiol-disulfide isomerase/thioredoxin